MVDYKLILKEFWTVVKSTAPLILVLFTMKLLLKSPVDSLKQFIFGFVFVLFGLFVFQRGIDMCLVPLGNDVGRSFREIGRPFAGTSSHEIMTTFLIIAACLAIGFASTLVEPALRVVARQAEEVSSGALKSNTLVYATALGCAIGMAVGIAKVLYNLKSAYIFIPIVIVALIVSFFAEDLIIGLAWDCASATTGPVNIPINSAIAIGLASVLPGVDPMRVGFGLVGLTSVCSASTVMLASVLRI